MSQAESPGTMRPGLPGFWPGSGRVSALSTCFKLENREQRKKEGQMEAISQEDFCGKGTVRPFLLPRPGAGPTSACPAFLWGTHLPLPRRAFP